MSSVHISDRARIRDHRFRVRSKARAKGVHLADWLGRRRRGRRGPAVTFRRGGRRFGDHIPAAAEEFRAERTDDT